MGKTYLENIAPCENGQIQLISGGSTSSDEDEKLENRRVRNFVAPVTPGKLASSLGNPDFTHVQRHYEKISTKYGEIGRGFIEICKYLDENKPKKYDQAIEFFDKKANDMNLLRYEVIKEEKVNVKGKERSIVTYRHPKNHDDQIIYMLDLDGKILKIDAKKSEKVILPPVWKNNQFEMELKSGKNSISYIGNYANEKNGQAYFSNISNRSRVNDDTNGKEVNLSR